jgi:hypothetical protein
MFNSQTKPMIPYSMPLSATRGEMTDIFDKLEGQPAPIGPGDADKIDADFVGLSNRRTRRGTLMTLEMSGEQLTDSVTGERGLAVAMACLSIVADDYAKRLREFADMMESASLRIRVALCNRDDMESVLKAAETELCSKEDVANG